MEFPLTLKPFFLVIALLGLCLVAQAAPPRHHFHEYKLKGLGHKRAVLDNINPDSTVQVEIIHQDPHFSLKMRVTATMRDGSTQVFDGPTANLPKGVVKVEIEFFGNGHNGKERGHLENATDENGKLFKIEDVRNLQCTDAHGSTATVQTVIR